MTPAKAQTATPAGATHPASLVPPGCVPEPWRRKRLGTGHLVRRAAQSPGPQATPPRPPAPGKPTFCTPTTVLFGDAVGGGKPQGLRAPGAEAASTPRAAACRPPSAPGVELRTSNLLQAEESGAAWRAVGGGVSRVGVKGWRAARNSYRRLRQGQMRRSWSPLCGVAGISGDKGESVHRCT